MDEFMKILLSLSVSGTILSLFILGLKPFYKDRFSMGWQYYIWIIVALRFLLPFTPDTTIVGSLFEKIGRAKITGEIPASPDVPISANTADSGTAQVQANSGTAAAATREPFDIYVCLFFIWSAMAMVLFVRKITVYQGFIQYVKAGNTEVSDIKILNLLSDCEEKLNIKPKVELYCNPLVASPMMIGFFRPRIVLPDHELENKELPHIFAHELIHYRQMDMLYKWLIQVVVCAHWFNPFVYLLEREVNRACELSCDEKVISALDDNARREYGDTLISFLKPGNPYKNSLASVTLTEGAEQLKERLGAIMNFRKKTKLIATASFMAAALLSVDAFAIGAHASEKTKIPPITQDTSAYIGFDAAKNAALAHAGFKLEDTRYCNSWIEYNKKRPAYYEVEFAVGDIEYEYEIDLYNGAVLKCDTEYRNPPHSQTPAPNTAPGTNNTPTAADIGQEAAKQTALNHAGLTEPQVYHLEIKLDYDDGWLEYDVDFKYNGTEYEYTIDAATGNILKYDSELSAISKGSRGNATPNNTADIGQEMAKQIALNHAGLTEPQVNRMKIDLDYDDGRLEYEVEFRCNRIEYDYTIDGATGNILKYERDDD